MAVQIGAPPESGFDNPIGMLIDCHRRIEHFLHILCVVVERAGCRELTAEEASAIDAALNYFRAGGRRHTADEEESLFPRMHGLGSNSDLDALRTDHQVADGLHAEIEGRYRKWMTDGAIHRVEHTCLSDMTKRLAQLYRDHIRLEEDTIFPRALRTLDEDAIEQMGQEFRQRRASAEPPRQAT